MEFGRTYTDGSLHFAMKGKRISLPSASFHPVATPFYSILIQFIRMFVLFMLPQVQNMSEVTVYAPPGVPILWLPPPAPWTYITVVISGITLLCLLFGTKACCKYCWAAQTTQSRKTTQAGISSACLNDQRRSTTATLPWSRYPREGVDLATFVTRRAEPTSHAQNRGLEKPSTTGEGVLPSPGLDEGEQAYTDNLFGTLDSGQDEGELTGEGMTTVEEGHKFPPSPPTVGEPPSPQRNGGPWWKELLASPVKRLRLGHWSQRFQNAIMPDLKLPPPMRPLSEEPKLQAAPHVEVSRKPRRGQGTPSGKARRKDPKRPSARNLPKRCRRNAVKLATSKKKAEDLVKKVEKDFYANSSRAAQTSRRKTVENILNAGELSLPLTPTALKFVVGTLKEAGYKSAQIYLAEAKNMHVEKGFPWSHLLDRNYYKLCSAAAKRGAGPRKKAVEVAEHQWASRQLLDFTSPRGNKVILSAHLFACGVHWMMREIELAALKSSDVNFDAHNRTVTITWEQSKMDSECRGLARTLQCICNDGCDMRCPYAVLEVLVNNAALKGAKGGHLAFNDKGDSATKAEIVGDWQKNCTERRCRGTPHGDRVPSNTFARDGRLAK